jgi:hypothetical protein
VQLGADLPPAVPIGDQVEAGQQIGIRGQGRFLLERLKRL